MIDEPDELIVLNVHDCLELLRSSEVGRLAILADGAPRRLPGQLHGGRRRRRLPYGARYEARDAHPQPGRDVRGGRLSPRNPRRLVRDHQGPGRAHHRSLRAVRRRRPAAVPLARRSQATLRAHRARRDDRAPIQRRHAVAGRARGPGLLAGRRTSSRPLDRAAVRPTGPTSSSGIRPPARPRSRTVPHGGRLPPRTSSRPRLPRGLMAGSRPAVIAHRQRRAHREPAPSPAARRP